MWLGRNKYGGKSLYTTSGVPSAGISTGIWPEAEQPQGATPLCDGISSQSAALLASVTPARNVPTMRKLYLS